MCQRTLNCFVPGLADSTEISYIINHQLSFVPTSFQPNSVSECLVTAHVTTISFNCVPDPTQLLDSSTPHPNKCVFTFAALNIVSQTPPYDLLSSTPPSFEFFLHITQHSLLISSCAHVITLPQHHSYGTESGSWMREHHLNSSHGFLKFLSFSNWDIVDLIASRACYHRKFKREHSVFACVWYVCVRVYVV